MSLLDNLLTDGQIITTPSGTQYQFVASENRVKRIPGAGESRPPSITSFAPNPASLEATLSIQGTNFLFTAANTTVDFAKQGGGRTLSPSVTVSSNTSLSVLVPADAAEGQVVVTTLDGSGTSAGTLQISQFDVNALAVIDAIEATGVTLTATQKNACDVRVKAFKANGTWSSLNFYYGFLGGTAAAHAINWKNPGTNNIAWNGGAHGATGSAPTAAANYGDTGLIASYAAFPTSGWAIACYVTVAATVPTALNWGQSTATNLVGLQKLTGGNFGGLMFNTQANSTISIEPPSKGFRLAQRKSSSLVNFLVNTTISADISSAVASEASGTSFRIFGPGTFAQIQTYGSWTSWNAPMTNAKLLQEQVDEFAYQTALSRS